MLDNSEAEKVWLVIPGFAAYAESAGGLGIQATQKDQLEAAMQQVMAYPGPALLEVKTDVGLI